MNEKCLLDMDNVLVDFVRGSLAVHEIGLTVDELWTGYLGEWNYYTHSGMLGMTSAEFYAPMDEEYWANLPWMPDGEAILEMVERRFGRGHVVIVTSPSANRGCHEGKLRWMRRHLPEHYSTSRGHVFAASKWLMSNPSHTLVDDSDDNCEAFALYGGGKACLVPRHWNKLHDKRERVLEHVAARIGL